MTRRRLMMVNKILMIRGTAILVFMLVDRTQEPNQPATRILRDFGQVAIQVKDPTNKTKKRCALTAHTERQQQRGLMQVTDRTLGGHDGMVFLFEQPQQTNFWMRNTPMPLSIAYFDHRGQYVSQTDMTPCADSPSYPSYPPASPYQSAIEVPRGRLSSLGINPNSRLETAKTCPKS